MQAYIVHFGELGLKGRNRIFFARQLVSYPRLRQKAWRRFLHSHILVKAREGAARGHRTTVRHFGIAHYLAMVAPILRRSADRARLAEGVITSATTF